MLYQDCQGIGLQNSGKERDNFHPELLSSVLGVLSTLYNPEKPQGTSLLELF
jgi:hypothetical protein